MAEENAGVAIPGEREGGGSFAPDQEAVKQASSMGWVDKPDFKGDPNKWVDAATYVKRGEEIMPILRATNKRLEEKLQEQNGLIKEISEHHKNTEKRAYDKALRDIEQRRLQAVTDGDVNAFKTAEKDREDLARQAIPDKPQESPEMVSFRATNGWYDTDPEMTAEADAFGVAYTRQGMQGTALLKKVEEKIRTLHPDKFANPRRSETSSVEGAGDIGFPKKGGNKTYADLPADAKKACERFIAAGYIKTRDQYLADYQWD